MLYLVRALGRCAERVVGLELHLPKKVKAATTCMAIRPTNLFRALLLSALLPSDRMWTPKVLCRSWGLAAMVHGDLAMGVLSAVPWLESSRRVRHAELLSGDLSPERPPNIVLLDSDAGFARATKGETRVYESPGDMLIANVSQEFCTVCVSIHICNTRAIVVYRPNGCQVFCCVFKSPCTSLVDTRCWERGRVHAPVYYYFKYCPVP